MKKLERKRGRDWQDNLNRKEVVKIILDSAEEAFSEYLALKRMREYLFKALMDLRNK